MSTRALLSHVCEGPGQPGYDLPWNKYKVVFTGLDGKVYARYANVKGAAKPKEQAIRQVVAQHCRDMGEQNSAKIGGIIRKYISGKAGQLSVTTVEVATPPQTGPKGGCSHDKVPQQVAEKRAVNITIFNPEEGSTDDFDKFINSNLDKQFFLVAQSSGYDSGQTFFAASESVTAEEVQSHQAYEYFKITGSQPDEDGVKITAEPLTVAEILSYFNEADDEVE